MHQQRARPGAARAILFSLLAIGAGCGGSLLAPDAGETADAGVKIADAGAGEIDAGELDAGVPDAGPADAGYDAGPPLMNFFRAERDGGQALVVRVHWGDTYWPRATGLPPGIEVTMRLRADQVNFEYTSWARFKVDPFGTVDIQRDAPIDGTWTGADFEGPVWSMTRAPDTVDALPFNALEIAFVTDAGTLASARLDRYYLDPLVVKTVPPSPTGLVAELYSPPNATNRPTVIVFGGSEGGIGSGRFDAYYLASIGYPALALAYFGMPGVPQSLSDIPLETWDRAYQWLSTRPEINPSKVVVMGGSRGGEAALALGANFPWVKGVIAQVPSGVSWPGDQIGVIRHPSWTLAGSGLPFISPSANFIGTTTTDPDGATLVHYRAAFETEIAAADPTALQAASFKVENTKGRVLILAGADDQLWPSCRLGKIAWDRLPMSHRAQYSDEYFCIANAGHAIPTPGSPTTGAHRAFDGSIYLALGGTPRGTATAARIADDRIRALLESL
jgi:pimeloyl-ACP methyl ester carboxylesterase